MLYRNRKFFCELFGNSISRKTGQKCCIYGQNGKPLREEVVEKFLNDLYKNIKMDLERTPLTDNEKRLRQINWQASQNYTRLYRLFYFRNVFLLTEFIKDLYELDYTTDIHQIPNIAVTNKELLKIELYTPMLKGLAHKDLQLAFAINTLDLEKYSLVPIKDEDSYKREIRLINIEDEKMGAGPTRTKLKNKYDALPLKGCGNNCACLAKEDIDITAHSTKLI
jgi:pterin-4a-carbinolamine dehydratase